MLSAQAQLIVTWEGPWRQLSREARLTLSRDVRSGNRQDGSPPIAGEVSDAVASELRRVGFVEEVAGRLTIPMRALFFIRHVQGLQRFHLLNESPPPDLAGHVLTLQPAEYTGGVQQVLRVAGFPPYVSQGELLHGYVLDPEWPDWAARSLRDPLAPEIIKAIDEAGGVVALDALPGLLPGHSPERVREVAARLIPTLALFEGLDPDTLDIMVGFLAAVRKARHQTEEVEPPLEIEPSPQEPLPEGGFEVNDLRAFLIELASGPARVKKDHSLYRKEEGRFAAILTPLPDWAGEWFAHQEGERLRTARYWAACLRLTRVANQAGEEWLQLTSDGQEWLAADLAEQYSRLFQFLRESQEDDRYTYRYADFLFLGTHLRAFAATPGSFGRSVLQDPERERLRKAFYAVFLDIPEGQFITIQSFLAHATFASNNPLHLGLQPRQVTVEFNGPPVPPLTEIRRRAAMNALIALINNRLIPLGCLQAAVSADRDALIARHPRLDAYFGQRVDPDVLAGVSTEGRVIVQPDFTVILIGTGSAPAADLAPFCERVSGRTGMGSLQLKITRSAVVGAVAAGLAGEEILARLRKHSSVPLPANVVREISDWSAWVRTVPVSSLMVLRCENRETADRVVSALGRKAERLSDTVVGVPQGELRGAEVSRLQEQGILARVPKQGRGKGKGRR
jgi:Helicase conserved C-terminal domain